MNKKDLIEAVARDAGLSKADAQRAVEAIFTTIQGSLKKGDRVSLVGFGTFEARKRPARVGRDPRTGAQISIRATKLPVLRAGKQLREAVSGDTDDPGPSVTKISKKRR